MSGPTRAKDKPSSLSQFRLQRGQGNSRKTNEAPVGAKPDEALEVSAFSMSILWPSAFRGQQLFKSTQCSKSQFQVETSTAKQSVSNSTSATHQQLRCLLQALRLLAILQAAPSFAF